MKRITKTFKISDKETFEKKALLFAQKSKHLVFLNSNNQPDDYKMQESILAFEPLSELLIEEDNAFEKLENYKKRTNDWLFGFLTYDLKNQLQRLKSENFDGLNFPDLFFFQPKKIIFINSNNVVFHYLLNNENEILKDFNSINSLTIVEDFTKANLEIKQRISKEQYLEKVKQMQYEIAQGNIYEANFCMEFFSENKPIKPLKTYWDLNNISKAPFSSLLKMNNKYAISASPERYIQKQNQTIISQPIKGTAKRSGNKLEDENLKHQLQSNQKERAENIMIVDLVRNDMSKIAKKNSVTVDELCGIYSYNQTHNMISTIRAELNSEATFIDVIKETFPMGSMTGAPKYSAMKIIENLEQTKRGLYSGAIGYFTPEDDFDFNVVIRSVLYNQSEQYVSFSVGSAITFKAIAEQEYEECLLKAKAMKQVLSC